MNVTRHNYSIQKSIALRTFAALVLHKYGIMETCELTSVCTGFSFRRWAKDIFGDFFFNTSNIDDVTDDKLDKELESGRR